MRRVTEIFVSYETKISVGTKGKQMVKVKLQAHPGNFAGALLEWFVRSEGGGGGSEVSRWCQ
jgi:hypothetical protein